MAYFITFAPMKETALIHRHRENNARIIPFAGYQMPVEYSGVKDEHITVRNAVGVFDVSHMGEIWVKGEKALDLLQRLTCNDIRLLHPGKIQYTCLINANGGIVDDVLVYMYDEQKYFLVVNASNIEKDWNWMVDNNDEGAILENSSDSISQLSVQGPKAIDTLQKLCELDLRAIKYYNFSQGKFAGADEVIISNSGYTGAGGFELYFHNKEAEKIWDAVLDAGKEYGIKPVGLAARDTLRLEMGFCLYGNDIDDRTSPIEAGLGWLTKFTENNNFISRKIIEKQKLDGTGRRLVGFTMTEKGIPRQYYEILEPGGEFIGSVTSGTISPMMNVGIGMGYVRSAYAKPGTNILIKIRDKHVKAEVVKFPILKKSPE